MRDHSLSDSKRLIAEFLDMVERLYLENYALRYILTNAKLRDNSPAVPNWESHLREFSSNKILAEQIHRTKFEPLFGQIRQATQAVAVDEVLRSTERATSEGE